MHTDVAFMKLFAEADMVVKPWRKLEENFEKTSNPRVVQLSKNLAPEKSVAKYVEEFSGVKMDLETAGPRSSQRWSWRSMC